VRDSLLPNYLDTLQNRALSDGGFASQVGGEYRPDATAWAVLALVAAGIQDEVIINDRSRLASSQHADGRVSITLDRPDAFWPTPLAVLAWHGSPMHARPQTRAINFLLITYGIHWVKKSDSPVAHDTSIPGWPWTENTHSWVEPTALSLLALRATGYGKHKRALAAVRLLMDRQLPAGGWNYGNTFVYGQELFPQPDCTGLALSALVGYVPLEKVQQSLNYLQTRINRLRTPLSLGWGLLGLGAWGKRPEKARSWIMECLKRQERYGPYDTSLLSLLLLALLGHEGFFSLVGK
jgi:hypothetical protein